MSTVLGTISIDLVANTVSFSKEMGRMGQLSASTSKNIQRSLSLVSGAATAMASSIVASLTAAIVKAEDFAFSMQKMATQTGSSVDTFSKLAYSAKLAGVPMEDLRYAMERMARTSYSAQGGQKQAVQAYAALGISVKDLRGPLKDTGSLFLAVAKGMDKYADSTAKTGLLQKILGRSGAELTPVIKQVAMGFDTASKQATLFGVVVGDKTAAQAYQLHQSLEQLESISLGFAMRLLTGVSPALQDASTKIIQFVTSANGMKTVDKIAADVSKTIYGLGHAFEFLTEHTTAVKRTIEGVAAIQTASIFLPMITGAARAKGGIDSIGLVALKMVSRMSGLTSLGTAFAPLVKGAVTGETSLLKLARAFGPVETGIYAAKTAFKAFSTTLLENPYVAVGAVLATVAVGLYKVADAAKQSEIDGGKWGDVWHGVAMGMEEDLNDVRKALDLLTGDMADFASRDWKFTPFKGLVQQAGQARRGMTDDQYRMLGQFNDADKLLQGIQQSAPSTKPEAPAVSMVNSKDKIDHLKIKMDELAASAKAAQASLRDAGKSVDFQRADEITQEYTKTVIALEAQLKAQGKTLSGADKAAIGASIATRINDLSQAKYRDELSKVTEGLLSQTQAQDILTAAIGRGSNAVRAAAIAANAAKRDAGKSDEWKQNNAVARSKDDVAFGMNYDRSNANSDRTAVTGIQAQINAQLRLNGAIVQGTRAREDAALAAEQDTIRKQHADKGDIDLSALDAELAANERLFRLKQEEVNLNRAMSMDPTAVFREQAAAIESAASAARDAGRAISDMQIAAANKAAWNSYLESIDRVNMAVGDAGDGVRTFFNQMSRDTESAAEKVHTILGGAFSTLNDTLVKLVEGQKDSFAEFFRGISASLAKLAIQKTEQGITSSIMKSLGKGDKKPEVALQVTANNYLSQMLDVLKRMAASSAMAGGIPGVLGSGTGSSGNGYTAMTGLGSLPSLITGTGILGANGRATNPIGTVGSLLTGGSSSSSATQATGASGFFGRLLGSLAGVAGHYGGGFANGGDLTAGMSYDVGELGKERFTPTVNGRITPNNKLNNGSPTIHIDARGSNDPAQTEAAIHRAIQSYGPAIAAGANKASHEQKMRAPLSNSHR